MKIEIFSMMAALCGDRDTMWVGNVNMPAVQDINEANERLWRMFNRVTEDDSIRLEEIGYRLPSLSVGDYITWNGRTYKVTSGGFDCITRSEEAVSSHIASVLS